MRHTSALTLSLSALAGPVSAMGWTGQYKYGNMFYSGPLKKGVTITRATYSMTPPSVPCGYATSGGNEELALWIGIQNDPTGKDVSQESFVQPLVNWAPDQQLIGCDTDSEHWCIAASTYTTAGQVVQPYKPIEAGTQLDFELLVGSAVTQSISSGGELLSKQTNAAGMKPAVFYGANECYLQSCGTIDAYTWKDIVIHLSAADPDFGSTLQLFNATSDGFQTTDGGKTWTNTGITFEKDYLYSDDLAYECS